MEKKDYFENHINRVYILIVVIFFHMILFFQVHLINLTGNKSISGSLIAIVLLLLCLTLMHLNSEFKPLAKNLLTRTAQSINCYDFDSVSRLFLIFSISITIFGIFIRIVIINLVPLDVQIADMLPLIQNASEVLVNGQNPYRFYFIPHKLPLTLWPGLWLPYSFASILKIDPRWIGMLFWVIISFIFISYSFKKAKQYQSPLLFVLCGFNILLFQVSFQLISFQGYGHTFPLWLWLILLSITIVEKKHLICAILLGLVLSSRQTAIIFLPILFTYWHYHTNLKLSIKYTAISFFVFVLITLPFIINSPNQFFIEPIKHYKELGGLATASKDGHWIEYSIGFSYIIQKELGVNLLPYFSYLAALIIGVISFFILKTPQKLLIYLAVSVTFFSFFTPIPWNYEYFLPLFFLFFAMIS